MSIHTGKIERGTGRATKLGFPTANIPFKGGGISGIYAARVTLNGATYNSAVYADGKRKLLEAHLLDFSGELYGHEIIIELLEKLRDDKMFKDDTKLRAAIADDVKKTREYFSN
jgi:riboflavin kinase / FMN adenylyltransferase